MGLIFSSYSPRTDLKKSSLLDKEWVYLTLSMELTWTEVSIEGGQLWIY